MTKACFLSNIDTTASGGLRKYLTSKRGGKYLTLKAGFFMRLYTVSMAAFSAACFSVAILIFTPLCRAFL